ncbi:MAG: GntR family transcriptional regulator [Pseudomonadota bacterium]
MNNSCKLNKINDIQLLKDRIYQNIKSSIIELHLYPGEQLTEQRLANELGVSKSPIREALQRLEQNGLVHMVPYKGCYVSKLEKEECRELFQTREALELFCIDQKMDSYTEQDIRDFEALMNIAVDEFNRGNESFAYNTHLSFHRMIIDKMENRLIQSIYSNIQDRMKRYLNYLVKYSPNRVKLSSEQHILLLKAIQRKDREGAMKELKHHLMTVLKDFLTTEEIMEGKKTDLPVIDGHNEG